MKTSGAFSLCQTQQLIAEYPCMYYIDYWQESVELAESEALAPPWVCLALHPSLSDRCNDPVAFCASWQRGLYVHKSSTVQRRRSLSRRLFLKFYFIVLLFQRTMTLHMLPVGPPGTLK